MIKGEKKRLRATISLQGFLKKAGGYRKLVAHNFVSLLIGHDGYLLNE
jgi:hypothetical protein